MAFDVLDREIPLVQIYMDTVRAPLLAFDGCYRALLVLFLHRLYPPYEESTDCHLQIKQHPHFLIEELLEWWIYPSSRESHIHFQAI
jgi:hypothetical protein